jgi:hypothetical protein
MRESGRLTRRDEIYLEMLEHALPAIRNMAQAGFLAYCAIETDHIHNLPSLIGETNEHRHAYYLRAERNLYLERVDRTIPGVSFLLARYAEAWSELETLLSLADE